MDEELLEKAEVYARSRGAKVARGLGFGIHGIVVALESESKPGQTALKVHFSAEPYGREREVYERLRELGCRKILGFHVPQLLRCDDALLALEMTVVMPPYVLDFAGAYVDFAPEFSDEIWEEWTRKNEEQFGANWPAAQMILGDLQDLGIHMHDPSPSNIRFE